MGFDKQKKHILITAILILSFQISFSIDSSTAAKKEIKNIDNKIAVQNKKIKSIDSEKDGIEAQIKKNEKEIESMKKEQQKLSEEIKKVKLSLSKNKKELLKTNGELKKIKMSHESEVLALNRYLIFNSADNVSELDKFTVQRILFKNVEKIENTEGEVSDIKQESAEIEKKRKELERLNTQANINRDKLNKKIDEQEKLLKKLDKDKVNYEAIVKDLKQKKLKIEKEIERIILASSKAKTKTTSTKTTKKEPPVKYSAAKKGVGRLEKPLSGEIVTRYKQSKSGIPINGIEIRGELGSTVKSSSKGKVIYSDNFQGLGKVVMIEYGYDLIGVYGNLISTDVNVGDSVGKSEKIGVLGYSSDGTPDLYYEVRFNMKSVNPESFF